MSKNPVIVFEGVEGSGKSHHISYVSKYLKKKKIAHIHIREPGGNLNSEKIRNVKNDKKVYLRSLLVKYRFILFITLTVNY